MSAVLVGNLLKGPPYPGIVGNFWSADDDVPDGVEVVEAEVGLVGVLHGGTVDDSVHHEPVDVPTSAMTCTACAGIKT